MPNHHRNLIFWKRLFSREGVLRFPGTRPNRCTLWSMWKRQKNSIHKLLDLSRLWQKIQSMSNKDHIWIRSMEICSKYCNCHQMPDRSFFIEKYQFPLCARCTGISLGYIAALLTAPFRSFSYYIAILMFPLAIDGTVQYFAKYESTNLKRIVTGILYGFAFTSIILQALKSAIKIIHK